MPRTTLVVPCYNEAERLDADAFLKFARAEPDVRFVMVDDGSHDATLERLRALEAETDGRIEVLSLARNAGKAEAVRQGTLAALSDTPEIVGYWDADLATPLDAVPEFLQVFERAPHVQLVVGSRVKLLGRSVERRAVRHYLGRVFATAASLTLGLPIYDTQCGAKLLRVERDTVRLFEAPFITGWIFDVELIARMLEHGDHAGTIFELPLRVWRDVPGSKVKATDFFRALYELMQIELRYRPRRRGAPA